MRSIPDLMRCLTSRLEGLSFLPFQPIDKTEQYGII